MRVAPNDVERIFELSLDLITVVGFDGRYVAVNPAWEQTLGYSSRELIGRPFSDFVHPDDLGASQEAFALVLEGGGINQFENRMVCADGSVRRLEWSGRPGPEQRVVYAIGRDVTELRRRDREHAALRRVATLVAREAPHDQVFTAIVEEARQLLDAEHFQMLHYEGQSATVVASAGEAPTGSRSAVEAPIVVKDRLWGVLSATTTEGKTLPAETESRLAQFTELMATAIANAQARAEVRRLADEQAALRRVATLVARGATPGAVLDAVVAEMDALLDADQVALNRFEPGDEMLVLAQRGLDPERTPAGSRVSTAGESVSGTVRRTGLPARMEGYDEAQGELADLARIAGLLSAVSVPIMVEGRLWGVITAGWKGERSPPADTEERMVRFAQLLDTAIANADSRDQLTASRARLVTAGDEARRRVVRDLHDGVQQRLVHAVIALKLAQRAFHEHGDTAETLVGEALEHAQRCNAELRELAHGILPSSLTSGGLRAGIDSQVERLSLPIDVEIASDRFPSEIEASAYFIVAEALTNIVKHSHASHAGVRVQARHGALCVEIRDDGTGGADPDGHGLIGMTDRVTALGGRLEITSPAGGGTLIAATLPLTGA